MLCAMLFCVSVLLSSPGYGEDRPVALFISQEIKPFIEMVEGFENRLNHPTLRIILDQQGHPFSHDKKYKGPEIDHYAYGVAVGPQALTFLIKQVHETRQQSQPNRQQSQLSRQQIQSTSPDPEGGQSDPFPSSPESFARILYAMVLDPSKFIPQEISLCGISLDPFTRKPLEEIRQLLPGVKTVGVIFDPANNKGWVMRAQASSLFDPVTLLPLPVKKESDLTRLYQGGFAGVEALLFIPDPTVSSPTLISHLIKQAFVRKIPVIGYNRFFHGSGAAVSVLIDYAGVGKQAAEMVETLLEEGGCTSTAPASSIAVNQKVIDLLKANE